MAQSDLGRSRTMMAAQLVDATDKAEALKALCGRLSLLLWAYSFCRTNNRLMVQGKAEHAG